MAENVGMTQWVEVNLPWRFFDKKENDKHHKYTSDYLKWMFNERLKMIGPSPSIDDYAKFSTWLEGQPETKAWKTIDADCQDQRQKRQFMSHPANKAGTVIEVRRDKDPEVQRLIIGDILTDGGDSGEWGLGVEDMVIRYIDLSEIIKEFS